MYHLPCAKPHDMGIRTDAITNTLRRLDSMNWGLHSFILVRHGHTVAEKWVAPYSPERPHMLFSLTKSFTSMAVGFAVDEGLFGVEDYIVDLFPEALSCQPCENMRKMRVRHLLTMSTGHLTEPPIVGAKDLLSTFLESYVEKEPDTLFLYNTAASCVLGILVEKVSGQRLDDYLATRLFEPLGFGAYHWQHTPEGHCYGGVGLSLQTRDIAKFGQFLLQKGRWGGRQLISETWITEATREHIRQSGEQNLEWSSGYGYQFWRCIHYGAYRGDGMFGQYCVVFPEEDMVIAITAGSGDMHSVLAVLYEELLPALSTEALPYDEDAQMRFNQLSLSITPPGGMEHSPLEQQWNGAAYKLNGGAHIRFRFDDDSRIIWSDGAGERSYPLRYGDWVYAGSHNPEDPYSEYLCAAAWARDDRLILDLVCVNTPTLTRMEIHFVGSAIHIRIHKSCDFGGVNDLEYFGIREDMLY